MVRLSNFKSCAHRMVQLPEFESPSFLLTCGPNTKIENIFIPRSDTIYMSSHLIYFSWTVLRAFSDSAGSSHFISAQLQVNVRNYKNNVNDLNVRGKYRFQFVIMKFGVILLDSIDKTFVHDLHRTNPLRSDNTKIKWLTSYPAAFKCNPSHKKF